MVTHKPVPPQLSVADLKLKLFWDKNMKNLEHNNCRKFKTSFICCSSKKVNISQNSQIPILHLCVSMKLCTQPPRHVGEEHGDSSHDMYLSL